MSANNISDEKNLPNDFDVKLGNLWAKNRSGTGPQINDGGGGDKGGSFMGKLVGVAADIAKTQEISDPYSGIKDSYIEANVALTSLINSEGKLNDVKEIGKNLMEGTYHRFLDYLTEQTNLLHQVNEGTSLTGKLSEGVREELTNSSVPLMKYKIGFQEIVTASLDLTKTTSKFNLINSETWDKVGQSAKAYVGTLSDLTAMLPAFEKIGYGASDTAKQIQISGQRMMKLGLDSKSMLKEVGGSLDKINQYGFKDGVQGLANMVTKAKEFRMSMEETFTIANKVMDPEGAIDMAANLQSIGGAIGDLGDPLKMMYMATNNVEGIQDALIGAAQSLATFNKETGRFEITGVNLRRAKAMADQMGISYKELTQGAVAAAERSSAATAMLSNGLKLDKDQTDLITNLAHMKDGKMVMEVQGDKMREILGLKKEVKEVALEELTQSQAESLAEYQKRESEKTPEDIIRGQATNIELVTRDVNYILRLLTVESGKAGKSVMKSLDIDFDVISGKSKVMREKAGDYIKGASDEITSKLKNDKEVQKTAKMNSVEPKTVDNSSSSKNNENKGVDAASSTSTNVNLTVKADVPMDRVTNALINNTDFAYNFMNAFNTPGSYTQIPYANT
jgi:uncharacterized protein with FMN-binding domain